MRVILILLLLYSGLMWAQPTPRAGQLIKVNPPTSTFVPESSVETSNNNKKNAGKTQVAEPESNTSVRTAASPTLTNSTTNLSNTSSNTKSTPKVDARNANYDAPVAAPALAKPEPMGVQWLTIEEALLLQKGEKRKIFVDVYTEWCGWCKKMDQTTFGDPEVAAYLNNNYYPVRFNAEQTESIEFKDKTYRYVRNSGRGYHELAAEWLQNRLTFPTVVFLDENLNLIQPIPGYQEPAKLRMILEYFGTDSHRTTPWETFEKKHGSR